MNKKYLFLFLVTFVVLVIVGYYFIMGRGEQKAAVQQDSLTEIPVPLAENPSIEAPLPSPEDMRKQLDALENEPFAAKIQALQALAGQTKATGDQFALGTVYNELAALYLQHDDKEKAIGYLVQLGELNEALNQFFFAGNNYTTVGHLYLGEGYPEYAVVQFKKALELYKKADKKQDIAHAHYNLGQAALIINDLALAVEHLRYSLEINIELDNKEAIAKNYSGLAALQMMVGRFAQAEDFQVASLLIHINLNDKASIIEDYIALGRIYIAKKDEKNACKSLSEAYKMLSSPNVQYSGDPTEALRSVDALMAEGKCPLSESGLGF